MAENSQRYLRLMLYVPKKEVRLMVCFLEHRNAVFSRELYNGVRTFRNAFDKAIATSTSQHSQRKSECESFRVNLVYLQPYEDEYKMIKENKKYPLMRDMLRQIAVFGTLSSEHALTTEYCRNTTYKNRKGKSAPKSLKEEQPVLTSPEIMPQSSHDEGLLAMLKGKASPRELFAPGRESDLYAVMRAEVSDFVLGKRADLVDVQYDWSSVPPSEYPELIHKTGRIIHLNTLLQRVNPDLIGK